MLNKIELFPDVIYNKLLSDPTPYTINSLYYSKQGEEIEEFTEFISERWMDIIHRGGDGDPIDVMLGIDLIMEKNGKVQTIQCKKVWNIEKLDKTTMNL